jgi:hypothetical protein
MAMIKTSRAYKSAEAKEHGQLFYIRSWDITPSQLYAISSSLQEDGHEFPQLDEWKFVCFIAGTRGLTVRYIGTTNSRKNCLRHFRDDGNNKSEKHSWSFHELPITKISCGVQ